MSSEIINPTITVDFTGTTPAGGSSLGYLTEGFHTGTVLETRQYEDNAGRLYVYMITDGTGRASTCPGTASLSSWASSSPLESPRTR